MALGYAYIHLQHLTYHGIGLWSLPKGSPAGQYNTLLRQQSHARHDYVGMPLMDTTDKFSKISYFS